MESIATSCISSGDTLRPPQCEQVGGDQCCFVALPLPDAGDQHVSGRISQLVEPALQRGSCRFGIKARRGYAVVSEETLQVGDVHTEREQASRHGVAEQMGVDPFADPGSNGDGADDLAHPLARQHMWRA